MIKNKLESISKELKQFLVKYNTQSGLGHLLFLMTCITNGTAKEKFGKLASPMRQLYYLARLMVAQEFDGTNEFQFSEEDWQHIVDLLVQIENEYFQKFLPEVPEDVTKEWKKNVGVAMPTFLSYFNLGPLNYEEQLIEQIRVTFSSLDDIITNKIGVTTDELLQFYKNVDSWCAYNFQSLGLVLKDHPLRDNWKDYTDIELRTIDEATEEIKEMGKKRQPMMTLVADPV